MEQTPPRRRHPGPMADLPADIPTPRRVLIEEMRRGRDRTGRSLQDLASGMYSSKATLSRWLSGKALPTREQAVQWAELCGTDPDAIGRFWDEAQSTSAEPDRLVPAQRAASTSDGSSPGEPEPEARRSRRLLWIVPVLALVVVGAAVTVSWRGATRHDPPPPACARAGSGPAWAQPTPGQTAGLTFCPVEINGGRLPITGKFRLAGQVLGPPEVRQRMVLVVSSDPSTCDALGNPAPDARMLIRDALIGSPDGSWSYVDGLGYDEAVTYARNFEYVVASSNDVLNEIRNDRDHYLANGGDPDAYAGMTEMPAGAVVVARFDVPAGLYNGAPGTCRP